MNIQVGRIVDLDRHREPLPICSRCIVLEKAIRVHKREIDSARNFGDESRAHLKLWEVIRL